MPRQTIRSIKINGRSLPTVFEPMYTNITVEDDGGSVDVSQSTYRNILILVRGSVDAAEITIKKGTGALATKNDLRFTVQSGESAAVLIESGRFMQTEGEDKGKFVIDCSDQCQICAFVFD